MNDEKKPSGQTATAELDHRPAHRRTDAGLGMFERVNSLVGTTGIGTAPSIGGATEQAVELDSLPRIAGVRSTPIGLPESGSDDVDEVHEDDDRGNRK